MKTLENTQSNNKIFVFITCIDFEEKNVKIQETPANNLEDKVAQNNLGVKYYQGKGVTQDFSIAKKYFEEAAEQGNADAQNNLGIMYYQGNDGKQHITTAKEWFEKSAEQGNANAQNNLGRIYSIVGGIPNDYALAKKWFEKAAEQEYADAQYSLGVTYSKEGFGITKDYMKTKEWFEKAAKQGHANAQYGLGVIYHQGYIGKHNSSLAKEWFEKAAEQGNANAQYDLGVIYYEDHQDFINARKWLEKAANENIIEAQYNLGVIYHQGQGVNPSTLIAKAWYKKAAEKGHTKAQYNLGIIYTKEQDVEGNFEKAIECFEKAADQKYAPAQYNLGIMYYQGNGVKQDLTQTIKWLEKAAKQEYIVAEYTLGMMYEQGEGVTQDFSIAKAWYEKAAKQGYSEAKTQLDSIIKKIQEQVCTEPKKNDTPRGYIKNPEERKIPMGKDAPVNLTDIFEDYSQEDREQAIDFLRLPKEERDELLNLDQNFNKKSETIEQPSYQDLEKARIEEVKARYIAFPKNREITVDNILAHLESQLSHDLTYFGADKDRIYLDELRKIEPLTNKMYQKLYYEHKKDASIPVIPDIISKITKKVTKRVNSFIVTDKTTLNEYHRNKSAEYKRKKKNQSNPLISEYAVT